MPIRTIFKVLLGLTILEYAAYAKEPEIQVKDGRVSIAAENVPLGRLLSLLDRAMGMESKVKPELASRTINVQFSDLSFEDAVRKIFQGQPLNYVVIAGKSIQVTELAQAAPVSNAPRAAYETPVQQNNPFAPMPPPMQPAAPAAGAPANQQPAITIFGARPDPNAAAGTNTPYAGPANNVPGGGALSNNPALSLAPPIVGQPPATPPPQGGAPQPQGGIPVGAPVPPSQALPGAPR